MTPEQQIAALVGVSPIVSVILLFLIQRVWPDLMAARQAARASEREERTELLDIIRQNTSAFVELRASIQAQTSLLSAQATALHDVQEDVRDLRANLQLPRTKE